MKKILVLTLALIMILALCSCSSGKVYVEMNVKDYGTVIMELDSKAAPVTVKNFVGLVESGFYNGLTFHRVLSGFVIQGGDPLGNGYGRTDPIKGEFAANGFKNPIEHKRGVLSLARANEYNSGSCQFFIVHDDAAQSSLDGLYAAFGCVIEGMEVVDKICETVPVEDRKGTVLPENQPVIESMKVIEYTK